MYNTNRHEATTTEGVIYMKVVPAHYEILTTISTGAVRELKAIEEIARSCYGSEDKTTEDSYKKFIKGLICRGHMSPIEHSVLSVRFTVDRAMSHELVRHRLASFMQSSQRYQNYGSPKYDNEITVIDIDPHILKGTLPYRNWLNSCQRAEYDYMKLIELGCKPEQARTVLPTSTATQLTITANYREWRHILCVRTGNGAYPPLRNLCIMLHNELRQKIPIIFDDLIYGDLLP